jgi:hypothetical protein
MNDLSPEARAIVEGSRNADVLSRADRERLKQGVLLRLATLGVATATTGTAAGMSLAAKLALTAIAATVLGGSAVSVWELRRLPAKPAGVAQQSSSTEVSAAVLPLPEETHKDTLVPANSPSADSRRDSARHDGAKKASKHAVANAPAPSVASAVTGPLDPEPELRVLRQAREDLRAGLAESAYQRLVDYDRQHGRGVLVQERQALTVIALCKWHPGSDAQTRAAEFLRSAPESPLADRVLSECESSAGAAR